MSHNHVDTLQYSPNKDPRHGNSTRGLDRPWHFLPREWPVEELTQNSARDEGSTFLCLVPIWRTRPGSRTPVDFPTFLLKEPSAPVCRQVLPLGWGLLLCQGNCKEEMSLGAAYSARKRWTMQSQVYHQHIPTYLVLLGPCPSPASHSRQSVLSSVGLAEGQTPGWLSSRPPPAAQLSHH